MLLAIVARMNKIIFINNEARRPRSLGRLEPCTSAASARAESLHLGRMAGDHNVMARIVWNRDKAHSLTESVWVNLADMHVAGTERGGAQCSALGKGSSCAYAR